MRLDSSSRLAFIVATVTLLAVACYEFLPDRVISLYPGDHFATTNVYSDKQSGGSSEASWIDAKRMHWRCDVREAGVPRFCGMHIVFFPEASRGWDLTHYSAVRLKLKAKTTDQRIRIIFRNFERGFSTEGNISSAKYMNALIPAEFLGGTLTVWLQEFVVAEWWINQWNVPRGLAYPRFNDIRSMSIDLGSPAALGVHEFQLESLQFVGLWVSPEQWYLGIMILFIGCFILISLFRYLQMKQRLVQESAHVAMLSKNTDELESTNTRYRELSLQDKLTGTLSRHGLAQVLECLKKSASSENTIGLLIVDLDHFKEINDLYGHDVGDKILVNVAKVLLRSIRTDDCVVRWGGEEFVVVCPVTNELSALALAEQLRAAVAAEKYPNLPGVRITASIGVGMFHADEAFECAFKRVDEALYGAKNGGRDRVQRAQAES